MSASGSLLVLFVIWYVMRRSFFFMHKFTIFNSKTREVNLACAWQFQHTVVSCLHWFITIGSFLKIILPMDVWLITLVSREIVWLHDRVALLIKFSFVISLVETKNILTIAKRKSYGMIEWVWWIYHGVAPLHKSS